MAQRRVRALLDAGERPRFDSGGDGLLLRTDARHVRLSDDGGALTHAGHLWEALTGRELPLSGFQRQVPRRVGETETIRLRGGGRGVARRWNRAERERDFTRLGTRFYNRLRRS